MFRGQDDITACPNGYRVKDALQRPQEVQKGQQGPQETQTAAGVGGDKRVGQPIIAQLKQRIEEERIDSYSDEDGGNISTLKMQRTSANFAVEKVLSD